MPIESLKHKSWVFVDTETTGTSPTYNQIIEIAIIRVEGGAVVDTYQTLIRPARMLPDYITAITGLTNQDLLLAPSFDEVALTIKEKLDGAIFVAHNARFDYSFVKNEFRRLSIPFQAKTVCTVKVSRALYPDAHSHNLDSILSRFDIACENRHRSYDDAFALIEFIKKSEKKLSVEIVARALSTALGSHTLPSTVAKDVIKNLPNDPGVYIFYGKDGEVLYVGKSVNIKTRVLSHFSGDHQSSRELKMCSEVCDIEARVTTGELSALFLESKLIKELLPVYNRLLRKVKKLALVREVMREDGFKSVSVEYVNTVDDAPLGEILGVFRTVRQAKEFCLAQVKEYGLCPKVSGLEAGRGACFDYQLERCSGACAGLVSAEEYNKKHTEAFSGRRLRTWPYKGAIVIKEEVEEYEGTGYVIDAWRITKVIHYNGDYYEESEVEDVGFDYDSYKILARHMLKPAVRRQITPYKKEREYQIH